MELRRVYDDIPNSVLKELIELNKKIVSRNEGKMIQKELVTAIYNSILVENVEIYKNLFETTKVGSKTTEYWKSSLGVYEKLSDGDKKVLLKIIEQTIIDTISNMLGAIDGSSTLAKFEHEIGLTAENQNIQGDLQDIFLEMVEKSKK